MAMSTVNFVKHVIQMSECESLDRRSHLENGRGQADSEKHRQKLVSASNETQAIPPELPKCLAGPCATGHPHPSSSAGCSRPTRHAGRAPAPVFHEFRNALSKG